MEGKTSEDHILNRQMRYMQLFDEMPIEGIDFGPGRGPTESHLPDAKAAPAEPLTAPPQKPQFRDPAAMFG